MTATKLSPEKPWRITSAARAAPGISRLNPAFVVASLTSPAPVSHTGAYVAYGIAGALAVGAAIMTLVTRGTYQSAVGEFSNPGTSPRPTVGSPGDSGSKLKWMGPLTDSLWAGAVVAAGTGTVLFFTARPNGSGGELAVGGRF